MVIVLVKDEKALAAALRAARRLPPEVWKALAPYVADIKTVDTGSPAAAKRKLLDELKQLNEFENSTAHEEYQPDSAQDEERLKGDF